VIGGLHGSTRHYFCRAYASTACSLPEVARYFDMHISMAARISRHADAKIKNSPLPDFYDRFSTKRPVFEPTTGWQSKIATDSELNPHGRTASTELCLGHQACQGGASRWIPRATSATALRSTSCLCRRSSGSRRARAELFRGFLIGLRGQST